MREERERYRWAGLGWTKSRQLSVRSACLNSSREDVEAQARRAGRREGRKEVKEGDLEGSCRARRRR